MRPAPARFAGLLALCIVMATPGCSKLAAPTVESALIEAGASPAVAACMAQRMTDRLSLAQLQQLRRLRPQPGESARGLSAPDLIERVGRVDDPQVIAVTARAGAACLLAR